ncbi:hypothetical protein J8273_8989 [Carpediemonas membranifera]|uniref:Uncharacterized protein n=1 Tax=Carpediemonas membranifera TaxID=201153 RepID=A0A8J6ARM7_9EUKA|nr:hypothetical protein J8273_8989 [Carpediemonas membranifera]|eukprot:KAG9389685.1 hypothetical protein J8273_8989 [Carpediemonas membranifera]
MKQVPKKKSPGTYRAFTGHDLTTNLSKITFRAMLTCFFVIVDDIDVDSGLSLGMPKDSVLSAYNTVVSNLLVPVYGGFVALKKKNFNEKGLLDWARDLGYKLGYTKTKPIIYHQLTPKEKPSAKDLSVFMKEMANVLRLANAPDMDIENLKKMKFIFPTGLLLDARQRYHKQSVQTKKAEGR